MKRHAHLTTLLAATAGYVLLVLAFFPQSYWENDNLGILDDIRQGHTVSFMSVLLGRVLSFLYRNVADSVPWYGVLMYGVTGAAFCLAAVSIDRLCRRRVFKYAFLAVLAVHGARFLVNVSYNATSITIGFACLVTLLVHLRSQERPGWWTVLGLGILFTFTYLVRTSGLKAVGLFASLVVGYELVSRWRTSWRPVALFLLPLAATLAIDAGLNRFTISEEHLRFRQWNAVRGKVHDYPVLSANDGNEELLEVNDWDPIHYTLLQSWAFFDETKFTAETVGNIRKYSVPLPGDDGVPIGTILGHTGDLLRDYWPQWLILVVLALPAFLSGRRRVALLQVALALMFLGGGTLMATYLRFPARIAYPLFFGAMLCSFFLVFRRDRGEAAGDEQTKASRPFLAVALLLLVLGAIDAVDVAGRIDRTGREQQLYYSYEARLRELEPEILIMSGTQSSGRENRDPLVVHQNLLPVVPAGWGIFSPRFYAFLDAHGLDSADDLLPHMVGRDRAYIVGSKHFANLLSQYLLFTRNIRSQPRLIDTIEEGLLVYQLEIGTANRVHPGPKAYYH